MLPTSTNLKCGTRPCLDSLKLYSETSAVFCIKCVTVNDSLMMTSAFVINKKKISFSLKNSCVTVDPLVCVVISDASRSTGLSVL